MKYTAIVLAAGSGTRTGLKDNKILVKIHNKRVVDYSLDFFENDMDCHQIILVINSLDSKKFILTENSKVSNIIFGGSTRQESVQNSLDFIQEKYVLIHDAARPYIPKKNVQVLKEEMIDYSSVTLGIPVTDTIQRVESSYITETLNRNHLIATQTPQGFHKDILIEAHKLAMKKQVVATDDTTLLLNLLHIPARFVEGDKRNIKFTNMEDLMFLEVIL